MTRAVSLSILSAVLFGSLSGCGENGASPQEAYVRKEHPWTLVPLARLNFNESLLGLHELPLVPYADDYYPVRNGGIAARWQLPKERQRSYTPVTLAQARRMTRDQLALLSPAEKFGLVSGQENFAAEILRRDGASAPEWMGYCNAWAIASLFYQEPKPVTISANGLEVPFGSSDVKALLTENIFRMQKHVGRSEGGIIGRCDIQGVCEGSLNAGAMHLAITEMIGKQRKGVVADLQAGPEKWNYPIFRYDAKDITGAVVAGLGGGDAGKASLMRSTGADASVKDIRVVKMDLTYRVEAVADWAPRGTGGFMETTSLCYTLELDARKEIRGGTYLSSGPAIPEACAKGRAPDYIFFKKTVEFMPGMTALENIYRRSVEQ